MNQAYVRAATFLVAAVCLGGCTGSYGTPTDTELTEVQQVRLRKLDENRKKIIAEHRRGPASRRRQTSPLSPHDR
jgi:hypothetical protein